MSPSIQLRICFICSILLVSLSFSGCEKINDLSEASRLHQSGEDHYNANEFHLGIQPLKRAFDLREKNLGSINSDTITTAQYYLSCLDSNGDDQEASKIATAYLQRIEMLVGKDSIQYAEIETILGSVTADLGEFEEAIELLRHAKETTISNYGKAHEESFLSMHNLNYVLAQAGKTDEAVEGESELFDLRKNAFGLEHRETIKSMTNLAFALSKQKEHVRALELHEQSLELRKKVFGAEHPETYVEMINLAVCYDRVGRVEEAIVLSRKGYEFFLGFYEESHPDVSWSALNLMRILPQEEYADERRSLQERHKLK